MFYFILQTLIWALLATVLGYLVGRLLKSLLIKLFCKALNPTDEAVYGEGAYFIRQGFGGGGFGFGGLLGLHFCPAVAQPKVSKAEEEHHRCPDVVQARSNAHEGVENGVNGHALEEVREHPDHKGNQEGVDGGAAPEIGQEVDEGDDHAGNRADHNEQHEAGDGGLPEAQQGIQFRGSLHQHEAEVYPLPKQGEQPQKEAADGAHHGCLTEQCAAAFLFVAAQEGVNDHSEGKQQGNMP